ncbi:MAG: hypothetical protein AAGA62_02025, partial [Bacteroidota bacterium]
TEKSYRIRAQFNELPARLFSGTQLQANIDIGTQRESLVIPSSCVGNDGTVVLAGGEEVQITIGSTNNQWTEVLAGLSPNDQIIQP